MNYRSKDAASAAALVYAEMSDRFGQDAVFLDYESIRLGQDYEIELSTRVRRSAVLLVVIGDRWLEGEPGERPIDDPADWVHREILLAMKHGVPVLPVLFPGATLDAARLPPALVALASYKYFRVRRRQRSDLVALGDHLLRQIPRLAAYQTRRTIAPVDGRRLVALTGLPPAVRTFVGREAELCRLSAVLCGDKPGECAVIAVLAGIGRTALALVAAHRALRAGWFPGGALMIDMCGYDVPDRQIRPETALGGLLTELGIRAEHVPSDSAARGTALARGLRTLIIVDNALASEQVRPLVPPVVGAPGVGNQQAHAYRPRRRGDEARCARPRRRGATGPRTPHRSRSRRRTCSAARRGGAVGPVVRRAALAIRIAGALLAARFSAPYCCGLAVGARPPPTLRRALAVFGDVGDQRWARRAQAYLRQTT